MTLRIASEQEIWREAVELIVRRMSPSKAVRFLSAIQFGSGNYTEERKELIPNVPAREMAEKIKKHHS